MTHLKDCEGNKMRTPRAKRAAGWCKAASGFVWIAHPGVVCPQGIIPQGRTQGCVNGQGFDRSLWGTRNRVWIWVVPRILFVPFFTERDFLF